MVQVLTVAPEPQSIRFLNISIKIEIFPLNACTRGTCQNRRRCSPSSRIHSLCCAHLPSLNQPHLARAGVAVGVALAVPFPFQSPLALPALAQAEERSAQARRGASTAHQQLGHQPWSSTVTRIAATRTPQAVIPGSAQLTGLGTGLCHNFRFLDVATHACVKERSTEYCGHLFALYMVIERQYWPKATGQPRSERERRRNEGFLGPTSTYHCDAESTARLSQKRWSTPQAPLVLCAEFRKAAAVAKEGRERATRENHATLTLHSLWHVVHLCGMRPNCFSYIQWRVSIKTGEQKRAQER